MKSDKKNKKNKSCDNDQNVFSNVHEKKKKKITK